MCILLLNLLNLNSSIHLLKKEEDSQEYSKVNPNNVHQIPYIKKAVPTLEVNGTYLIESFAIIEYLEETIPEPRLLPKDQLLRAKIRGFCEIINSAMHPY